MDSAHTISLVIASLACVTDLRTRRIPNVLTFGAALAALVYHVVGDGIDGLGYAVLGWLVGALIFSLPFALGDLGGGDLKLFAALGAWLGPADALWLSLYTGAASGAMALVVSTMYGYFGTAVRNITSRLQRWRLAESEPVPAIAREHGAGPRMAYAFPILAGMVATIWLR